MLRICTPTLLILALALAAVLAGASVDANAREMIYSQGPHTIVAA